MDIGGPFGEQQVRDFFERGYVVVEDLFSPAEVEEMRRAFDRLETFARLLGETRSFRGSLFVLERTPRGRPLPHVRIHRVVWCGAAEPILGRYGRDPRLVRRAAQLLGSRSVDQLINQAHFKLPGDGVAFDWHQDSTHRRYGGPDWTDVNGRGSYVQAALALDDVTEDNGPLVFVEGSCRHGHVEPGSDGRLPRHLLDPARMRPATMRAGSVVFFGPYTIHGSEPNRSDRPRRVLINGFAYPGANRRVYPGAGTGLHLEVGAGEAGPPPH